MFGDSTTLQMLDDGQGSDDVAGDGIYTGVIPAGLAKSGEMIRWYVTARDANGLSGRFPARANPLTDQEFVGTIVEDAPVESQLPVFHLFVESWSRATSGSGTSGALFYDGELYDNVRFGLHGQSSSGFSTQKKSMNVDFPNDHRFASARRLAPDGRHQPADELRGQIEAPQHAGLRAARDDRRRRTTWRFPFACTTTASSLPSMTLSKIADERWLDRLGLNPEGSLYKIYNTFDSVGTPRKENANGRRQQRLGRGDRRRSSGAAMTGITYIMDNVNLAQMANYRAGFVLTSNRDCCHKNFYAYRDTEGTGRMVVSALGRRPEPGSELGRIWAGLFRRHDVPGQYPGVGGYQQQPDEQALYPSPGFPAKCISAACGR